METVFETVSQDWAAGLDGRGKPGSEALKVWKAALKAVPEDSLSPTSGLPMEPTSAMSPFTPALASLMPLNPDEQLQLPLSKEMAL